ncbi:MAG TPA: YetF domain-containing protein [Luteibacter sp.]|jgi:uncharacterized membrane protein YcaP (DUF421 family)|uniref:YetF domain-containing protein n=1 Tax=Luteibacter sp. TaxID=1886636 RepID=UPI002F3F0642
MLGPFLGVAGIQVTDKAIAWASARAPWFNRVMEGFPTLLVREGQRDRAAMRSQSLTDPALDRALHAAGLEYEREVVIGRLEPNGKITLVRRAR